MVCWTLLAGTVLYAVADGIRRAVDPEQRRRRTSGDVYGTVDAGGAPGASHMRPEDNSDGGWWPFGGGYSADGGGGDGGGGVGGGD